MLPKIPIGPFSQFFISNWEDSTEMIEIAAFTTKDHEPTDQTPTLRLPGLDIAVQSGARIVDITLFFLSEDILYYNLCQGLDIYNTDRSAAPVANKFYSLLCVAADDDDQSIYIDKCRTERKFSRAKSKYKATDIPVAFIATDEIVKRLDVHYETITDLIPAMGPKYPF